ncbi:TrmB family transcriptional regulator [archaeon]|jgi:HTH-type transcriptional regulator, sugar sensing transcriptional regulator|nr:TrmB family transcriptional regulator [archaeon]MBT4373937.1 TrmB family transcriptional regulator [archaeon]MBT4532330.1 TrmB family transcriptional regulator [archaeon]MBT7001916.1 TrmB family transcriptional regulator [archaeon]MBT7282071.1 TrmB family transcriptional regulator [archaeon]
MIVKQEMVSKIKDYFGLNVYETKVWLALLSKGVASAGQIASISGVPRSRTYDVLESLEKRGFAIIKLGKPVKYLGVKPHMILEKLKNNVKKEAEDRVVNLSKIKTTNEYAQLESLYKEGIEPVNREELSASLKGKSNISGHLKEILLNATKEVIICTNVDEVASKKNLFKQTFDNLKKSQIKIKIALSGDERLIKDLEKRLEIKIKQIKIDTKFFVVDRKEILFYLSKESKDGDTAIWVNSEFFSQAFASLFDKAIKA